MNLLAIDTSTEHASIAISVNDVVYVEEQNNLKQHAQSILPMIERLLACAKATLAELDGVVFGCGPGSFTGLRIACSVAKALAYAHDLPLYPVSSLDAIVDEFYAREPSTEAGILAILDARMHEVYWAYSSQKNKLTTIQVSPASQIHLSNDGPLIIAGVGLSDYVSQLPDEIKARIVKQDSIFPNAKAMIRLVQSGYIQAAPDALPMYVRNQVTQGGTRG